MIVKPFTIRLFCRNCDRASSYRLPAGSEVKRGSVSGTTRVRFPIEEIPHWDEKQLHCPVCGSEKVR